jgi:hypothetical protein
LEKRVAVQRLRDASLAADPFWTRAATCAGSTSVVRQRPQPGHRVELDTRVVLLTNDLDCHPSVRHSRVGPVRTRMADRFARFARGEATAPPRHAAAVALLLGNRPVGRVSFAQSKDRRQWRGCPDRGYAASSCPVDFLAPFLTVGFNGTPLDYTLSAPDGACLVELPNEAHAALLSRGHVVISPMRRAASCANDFRYELFLDEWDVLIAVNLVLSNP